MRCPCCRSEIATPPDVSALREIASRPQVVAIAELLVHWYPRSVRIHLMVDHLYGASPDGGPDDALGVVAVNVSRARKAFKPLGWNIKRNGGAGYRLEKIDAS